MPAPKKVPVVASSLVQCSVLVATMTAWVSSLNAQSPATEKPVKHLILPGESFFVGDRPAFILWPDEAKRQKPQPWIMYAPTLRGLPDRHEKWMHERFLNAGVAVAGIDVGEAYGSPKGQSQFSAFYEELTKTRGFAPKPCLLGRSRGGLWISSWAISHPEKVAGLAGIYPVFDLRAYPGMKRAAPAFGLTPDELTVKLATLNPVSRLRVLAEASIPVFVIHGDIDRVVPLEANSGELVRQYEQAGGKNLTTLVVAEGQGHNFWPGFFRCDELIEFAIRTAKAGAESKSARNDE